MKFLRDLSITRFIVILLLSVLLVSACEPAIYTELDELPPENQQLIETIVASTLAAISTGSAVEDPVDGGSAPDAAVPDTGQPESPATLPPAATPTPTPHPMDISALQAEVQRGDYAGSDIAIERELDPGGNYRRFYASYLSDGYKIYALLTVPNGEMPAGGWPAIVFNHGYIPPDEYRTTERYIAYVDWIASSGYIVFRIDYRGHDQSEGEPSGAYGDPGYVHDVLNAVASMQRYPQANPDKIGMWGHSMGGYLTLRTMVVSPAVKVGVIWGGVVGSYTDMLYNWRRAATFTGPTSTPRPFSRSWRREWIEQYGTPEENPVFWNSVSAPAFLGNLSGPIQLHHSTTDEEVPVLFSQTLNQQILAAGKISELFTYEGDNHNISQNFSAAMSRTVEFFDRYLK